jgi:cathepsin B
MCHKMKVIVAFLALAAFASAVPLDTTPIVTDVLLAHINAEEPSYVAGHNPRFDGVSISEARGLLGTIFKTHYNLPVVSHDNFEVEDLPAEFDARTQWPQYIHPIRDQGQCGSCWAVSAAEVFSDRAAIASNGSVQGSAPNGYSPEDLVSCDTVDQGCRGGYLDKAWDYISQTGLLTDSCFPYVAGSSGTPPCPTTCQDSSAFTRTKAKGGYQLKTVDDIKKEIFTNGPVQAGFMVYKSFFAYTQGVYHKGLFEFTPEGGHAIKILGWGTEDNTPYWLCANSWGTAWGAQGFFKIKQGNCKIEEQVFAGIPAV